VRLTKEKDMAEIMQKEVIVVETEGGSAVHLVADVFEEKPAPEWEPYLATLDDQGKVVRVSTNFATEDPEKMQAMSEDCMGYLSRVIKRHFGERTIQSCYFTIAVVEQAKQGVCH
jgi:hypothetical protein